MTKTPSANPRTVRDISIESIPNREGPNKALKLTTYIRGVGHKEVFRPVLWGGSLCDAHGPMRLGAHEGTQLYTV